MNFKQLIEQLLSDGAIGSISESRLLQFGRGRRRYIGAELMPETLTDDNVLTEVRAALETVVAADGARYAPAQKARLMRLMSVNIGLGHQDISTELTPEDYDLLAAAFSAGDDLQAQATALALVERAILSLVEKNEVQRWQGLGTGGYTVSGAGMRDWIPVELPEGHRSEFEGDLSDPDFDAAEAFDAVASLLSAAGNPLTRIVAGTPMIQSFVRNPKVREWLVGSEGGFANRKRLAEALEADYGARLDTYDLYYTKQDGSRHRFARPDAFFLFGATSDEVGVTWEDEEGEHELLLPDTVGRVWIGKAAKRASPGRAVEMYATAGKAGGLVVDAWQTSAAGLITPSAVAVVTLNTEFSPFSLPDEEEEGEGTEVTEEE